MLSGQHRRLRRQWAFDTQTILTVACDAGSHLLGWCFAGRGCTGLYRRRTLQIGRNVLDVLIRERGGLRMHGGVRPRAVAILMQRRDQVFRILVAQFRHTVVRIRVAVIGDAVASIAGVELHLTFGRIARRMRAQRQTSQRRGGEPPSQSRKHLVLQDFLGSIRCSDVKEWAAKLPLNAGIPRIPGLNPRHSPDPVAASDPSAWFRPDIGRPLGRRGR